MQRKIVIFLSIFIVIIIIASANILVKNNNSANDSFELNGKINLQCLYYNSMDFMNVKAYNISEDVGTIRGLIVPHHLLAKDLIHEALQIVSNTKYKTIILIGPDHGSEIRGKAFTSSSDWQAPMGVLDADNHIINSISSLDFVLNNDEKLTAEHSISSLVPFVKFYFTDAKIVPIALTKQLSLQNIDELIMTLVDNILIEETLFIASVDFSHYLSLEKANEMDKISIEAILNKDLGKIMSFTNDNLDSPNSIAAILKYIELIKAKNIELLNNSNSEIILNKRVEETTSYVTILFY